MKLSRSLLNIALTSFAFTIVLAVSAQAQSSTRSTAAPTESVIYSFCPGGEYCAGGFGPGGLIADSAGNLYGATGYEGTGNGGTAFKVTPSGDETLLYSFSRAPNNGWRPAPQLVMDQQGNIYGVTTNGGTNSIHFYIGDGTVFKLSPDGTETTLYNFGSYTTDGAEPTAGLVMDASGNLYGTTFYGGTYREGTVFRLSPDGVETILHNFANSSSDGGNPRTSLIMDASGNLYGTTQIGGSGGGGTVFEISAAGNYSILHNFVGGQGDGYWPLAGLTLDSQGNLYGTTYEGGKAASQSSGIVYKLTPSSNGSWNETVLFNFGTLTGSCYNPSTNVLLGANGNLYGMTANGGPSNGGCAYELSPTGKLTLLHAFGQSGDAISPWGNIVFFQGSLYGIAGGGAYAEGSVFKITP